MTRSIFAMRYFTAIVFLTVFCRGAAIAVPGAPPFGIYEGAPFSPTVTVLETNADRVRLHFEMENLPSGPINLNQRQSGTWGEMNQEGTLLPRITFFIAIPPTGNPTRVIEEWNSTSINVSPATTIPENNPRPDSVILGDVGIIGGVRVVTLTIRPIAYNNSATTCRAMNSATISIEIDDAEGENSVPVSHRRENFSRPWQKVFQSTILNWETIPNFYAGAGSHILIIVPQIYSAQLATFIKWKEERGIKCTVVLKSEIGNNPTDTQIRNRIISDLEDSFVNGPTIDHVILVGDESDLAPNSLFTPDPLTRFNDATYPGPYTNEGYYCMVEGDDMFPDLFLGRWVANSAADVQSIVNRTIQHERSTFAGDSLRFERAFVAADFTEVTQRSTKRRVARMLDSHGFQDVDSLWGLAFDTPPDIFPDAVNLGQTFVNYRGSGWDTWWYGIFFTYDMIAEQINNQRRLPIITGIGCGVGIFNGTDDTGFGETWMTAGSPTNPEGAVGFIGPCWNTHTVFNDCLDSSLYRAFLDWDVQNLTAALVSAKMQAWGIYNLFNSDADVLEIMETLLRQYHCESDPSLQVFTDTPVRLSVTTPAMVPNVPSTVTVTVNNMTAVEAESLLVTIRVGAGDFSSRWIEPSESSVDVPVTAGAASHVIITVTGDNVLAFRDSVAVVLAGPYLIHQQAVLTETVGNGDHEINPGETLEWLETVQNGGNETAMGATGTLTTGATGVTITEATTTFPDIPSGQSRTANNPFTFQATADNIAQRNLNFTLNWTLSNGTPHSSPVTMIVHAPLVSTIQSPVDDDGDGEWERYETTGIRVVVTNSGNGDLAAGSYTISTNDPYVIALRSSTNVPLIARGQNYNIPADSFQFAASSITPTNHIADFLLTANIDQGTYSYPVSVPFQLQLESISAHDPFADDQGLYWIYDNTDTEYQDLPVYQWMEIAPQAGGLGTVLPFNATTDIAQVEVPFAFDWYNLTFNNITIAANGWARPGVTDSNHFNNEPLPDLRRPAGMIAPMWDEIFRLNTETGQVCYYYDEANGRFIIEWHQIHFRLNNFQQTETFQLQLLNPASHPTADGNAQWVILYSAATNRALGRGGCTVGMESPDQQHGFTYFDSLYHPGAATIELGRAILISTDSPELLDSPEPIAPRIPSSIELAQNFPNPFNPVTTITFGVPNSMNVTLDVFDMLGRNVATLVNGRVEAGQHKAIWNAVNAPTGLYIYRLSTPSETVSRKMLLMK